MKTILVYSIRLAIGLLFAATVHGQNFTNPLHIPPILSGNLTNDTFYYDLSMDHTHKFFPPYPGMVPTFSFNQSGFLGPTILWRKGSKVRMNVSNNLDHTSTVHWHGAHVFPRNDGGPHQTIPPHTVWSPAFTVLDNATTMWYHPHLHHHTLEQVNMGLAGLIIVEDPADPFDAQLPHTYGVDEIPLIVQDRQLLDNAGTTTIDTGCTMGGILLVNGDVNPVVTVPAQMVRFRLLNGSSERAYMLGMQNEMNQSVPFNLVATDAGYTAKPHSLETMPMAPGERAEWVVDFSGQQGQSFFLTNYPNSLEPSTPGGPSFADPSCYLVISNIDSVTTKMLEIVVGPPTANPITTIPAAFAPLDIPNVAGVDRQRTKNLWSYNTNPAAPPFSIDTINFDTAVINDTVRLGDIEVWTIANTLGNPLIPIGHPFHIHDVHFFVIEINGSTDIPEYLQGPKDVVFVPRGDTIKFITQFLDFHTPLESQYGYMYHCHILSHEDGGMMHQFVVVDPALLGTEGAGGQADPEWTLFPNPSAGHVSLRGSCGLRSRLLLYDLTGRQAAAFSLPPFNREQPLPELDLPPGIYQAQWVRPDGRSVRTLVIR